MKKIALGLVAGAVLSTAARADIDLSFPAGSSSDTAAIKALTGATGYHNPKDATTFTTTLASNAITLKYNIKMASGGAPYSATAGLLVPITKDWTLKNIKKADTIQFEMKSSAANKIKVIIGSPLYDAASASANAALTSPDQKVTTSFTKFSIPTSAFAMPSWYTDCAGDCLTTFFKDDGTNGATIEIGKSVEAINFQPQLDGGWNTDGSQLTKFASADFTVKNIVVVGASLYDDVMGKNCTNPISFQLDNFAAAKNPNLSKEGNYWYAFTDTSSDAVKLNDTATGASTITLPTGVKKWTPAGGVAAITATLEKNVTGSTFKYHAYAGWATVGIGFGAPNDGVGLDLSALTAIQFDLVVGADAATFVPGAAWDAKNVPIINFKVSTKATPDAAPYAIEVPVTQSTQSICVDVDALKQPSWYNERTYGDKVGPAITTEELMKMAWEMKIVDQGNELLHTSGPNTFAIGNVKLYGVDSAAVAAAREKIVVPVKCADTASDPTTCPPEVGIKKIAGLKSFSVSYSNGLVLSANVAPTAKIDVLRMNGTVVRSFTADKASSVKLGAGSYLVTVRNANGARTVSPLAVVR